MLNVHDITLCFSGEDLFSGVTFRLEAGDRVGLIGKNGAGKSTLLKIIAGEIECNKGTIATAKELTIGFLKQDIDFTKGRTILEETYQAFTKIITLENKIANINQQLSERTDYESESYLSLINDLEEFTTRYELLGGYYYQADTEKILLGLGFQREDFQKKTEIFSGGWRMRIELAKLLLQKNDILLLDEPTNHLDIESIIWLENFLKNYAGAVILISHDKMFLDNVTNRTIEIVSKRIYDYKKPYSKYLLLRAEIREKQLQSKKNQDKQIKHKKQLIERFRSKASKASMAQSLIKQLNKVKRVEIDAEEKAVMKVKFPISKQPGKVVLELEKVSKRYAEKQILKNVHFSIERGLKVAFVGQNGQGKSTLAKMIVGEVDYTGTIKIGHNVQIGYFAQNQAEYLEPETTVLQTMQEAADDTNRMKVRDMLGAFLFSADDVQKKIKMLSGGERNRLAICKMLLSPLNVLIMDEPTNHLDIISKNVLKRALMDFEGTLILISHDRDFLQGLTNKIYAFKNQIIKEYLGDIDYFLETHKIENLREIEKKTSKTSEKKQASCKRNDYEIEKKQRQLKNKLSKIEQKISNLENQIMDLDNNLYQNPDKISDASFFKSYQNKKNELEDSMQQWERIAEQVQD